MKRSRRVRLWMIALIMAMVPWAAVLLPGPQMYSSGVAWYGDMRCPAFEVESNAYFAPVMFSALFGPLVAVPAAFGIWLYARGRRFGRVTGRVAAGCVLLPQPIAPSLILVDLAASRGRCWSLWSQVAPGTFWMAPVCYAIVAVLMVTAVHVPPPRRPRWRRWPRRTLAAGTAVCVTLALVSSAQPPVPVQRSAHRRRPGSSGSRRTAVHRGRATTFRTRRPGPRTGSGRSSARAGQPAGSSPSSPECRRHR